MTKGLKLKAIMEYKINIYGPTDILVLSIADDTSYRYKAIMAKTL